MVAIANQHARIDECTALLQGTKERASKPTGASNNPNLSTRHWIQFGYHFSLFNPLAYHSRAILHKSSWDINFQFIIAALAPRPRPQHSMDPRIHLARREWINIMHSLSKCSSSSSQQQPHYSLWLMKRCSINLLVHTRLILSTHHQTIDWASGKTHGAPMHQRRSMMVVIMAGSVPASPYWPLNTQWPRDQWPLCQSNQTNKHAFIGPYMATITAGPYCTIQLPMLFYDPFHSGLLSESLSWPRWPENGGCCCRWLAGWPIQELTQLFI